MKTALLILFSTLCLSRAGDTNLPTYYLRDHTSSLWKGGHWQTNTIHNPSLLHQAALLPYVTRGPASIPMPNPNQNWVLRFQIYVDSQAKNQLLWDLIPTSTTTKTAPPAARISLDNNHLILELTTGTDHAWLNHTTNLKLSTPIRRNEWNFKEILIISQPDEQTVGWFETVNQPVQPRFFRGQSRMLRDPQPTRWTLAQIAMPAWRNVYLGELVLDPDTNSKPENANLKTHLLQ